MNIVYDKHTRPPKVLEVPGTSNKTDRTGYISTQKRIENLLAAGKRLVDYRSNQFDFPEGTEIDENFEDPTRAPGVDPADLFQAELGAKARINAQKARLDDLERSEAIEKEQSDKAEKAKADQKAYEEFQRVKKEMESRN